MSRIGKKPIEVPDGVKIRRDDSIITVEGPMGSLSGKIPEGVEAVLEGNVILVNTRSDDRVVRSLHGLIRTLVANMVTGVNKGFEKVSGDSWSRIPWAGSG